MEENLADEAALPPEIFDRENLAKDLEKVVEKLPAKQREIIWLYHREGLTFAEIGGLLEESINTVKSRYHRGILVLKELLLS